MLTRAYQREGVTHETLVLPADYGSSMKGATLLARRTTTPLTRPDLCHIFLDNDRKGFGWRCVSTGSSYVLVCRVAAGEPWPQEPRCFTTRPQEFLRPHLPEEISNAFPNQAL